MLLFGAEARFVLAWPVGAHFDMGRPDAFSPTALALVCLCVVALLVAQPWGGSSPTQLLVSATSGATRAANPLITPVTGPNAKAVTVHPPMPFQVRRALHTKSAFGTRLYRQRPYEPSTRERSPQMPRAHARPWLGRLAIGLVCIAVASRLFRYVLRSCPAQPLPVWTGPMPLGMQDAVPPQLSAHMMGIAGAVQVPSQPPGDSARGCTQGSRRKAKTAPYSLEQEAELLHPLLLYCRCAPMFRPSALYRLPPPG